MTPSEIGKIVRALPAAASDALRRWPEGRPHLGALVDTRRNRLSGYKVDGVVLPLRSAKALFRAGLAESPLTLWITLTAKGEKCRDWLQGKSSSDPWAHADGTDHSAIGPSGCFPCANLRR